LTNPERSLGFRAGGAFHPNNWGAFTRFRAPFVPRQALWPPHHATSRILSLRPGGATVTISDAEYAAEHNCDVWNALSG
jgi:para-nitrobenzyl esterase